jgi:hypothetical protein
MRHDKVRIGLREAPDCLDLLCREIATVVVERPGYVATSGAVIEEDGPDRIPLTAGTRDDRVVLAARGGR